MSNFRRQTKSQQGNFHQSSKGSNMGEYKRVADILQSIETREQIHGLVEPKVPSPATYRRNKTGHGPVSRPKLKVGSKLVFPMMRGKHGDLYFSAGWLVKETVGYALAVVLDWSEHDSFWNDTTATTQIIKVSNPDFEYLVGRLRPVAIHSYGQLGFPLFAPEECDPKDYKL